MSNTVLQGFHKTLYMSMDLVHFSYVAANSLPITHSNTRDSDAAH